jgi:hypothetical protein
MTVTEHTRTTTLQNFCIQGLSADILRISHIALYEEGIRVCAPGHDALLLETETENAAAIAVRTREIMERAGRHVLGPNTILRADVEIVSYPERWLDRERGGEMWDRIYAALQEIAQCSTFAFHSLEKLPRKAPHLTPDSTPPDTSLDTLDTHLTPEATQYIKQILR